MPDLGCGCSTADWSVSEYVDIMWFWFYIKLKQLVAKCHGPFYSTIMCVDKLSFLAVFQAVNLFVYLNPVIR